MKRVLDILNLIYFPGLTTSRLYLVNIELREFICHPPDAGSGKKETSQGSWSEGGWGWERPPPPNSLPISQIASPSLVHSLLQGEGDCPPTQPTRQSACDLWVVSN